MLKLKFLIFLLSQNFIFAFAKPIVDSATFYQTWKRDYDKQSRLERFDDYTKRQYHKRRTVNNYTSYENRRAHFLKGVEIAPHLDMWGRRKVPAPSWIHRNYGTRY